MLGKAAKVAVGEEVEVVAALERGREIRPRTTAKVRCICLQREVNLVAVAVSMSAVIAAKVQEEKVGTVAVEGGMLAEEEAVSVLVVAGLPGQTSLR